MVVSEGMLFVVELKVGTHCFGPHDACRGAKVYDQTHGFLACNGAPTL